MSNKQSIILAPIGQLRQQRLQPNLRGFLLSNSLETLSSQTIQPSNNPNNPRSVKQNNLHLLSPLVHDINVIFKLLLKDKIHVCSI